MRYLACVAAMVALPACSDDGGGTTGADSATTAGTGEDGADGAEADSGTGSASDDTATGSEGAADTSSAGDDTGGQFPDCEPDGGLRVGFATTSDFVGPQQCTVERLNPLGAGDYEVELDCLTLTLNPGADAIVLQQGSSYEVEHSMQGESLSFRDDSGALVLAVIRARQAAQVDEALFGPEFDVAVVDGVCPTEAGCERVAVDVGAKGGTKRIYSGGSTQAPGYEIRVGEAQTCADSDPHMLVDILVTRAL